MGRRIAEARLPIYLSKGVNMEAAGLEIGSPVTYVDQYGNEHPALITANWGGDNPTPSLNLVYISTDEKESDSYGRQIKRETSVVHESNQSAHGRYWTK